MGISGTGIRVGTVITGIDPTTKTVYLSAGTNGLIDTTTIHTVPPVVAYNSNTATVNGVSTIVLFSVNGLSIGSTVSGTVTISGSAVNAIAPGTTIIAIDPVTNTVTLSSPTIQAIPANTALNFRKASNFSETRLYQPWAVRLNSR